MCNLLDERENGRSFQRTFLGIPTFLAPVQCGCGVVAPGHRIGLWAAEESSACPGRAAPEVVIGMLPPQSMSFSHVMNINRGGWVVIFSRARFSGWGDPRFIPLRRDLSPDRVGAEWLLLLRAPFPECSVLVLLQIY